MIEKLLSAYRWIRWFFSYDDSNMTEDEKNERWWYNQT